MFVVDISLIYPIGGICITLLVLYLIDLSGRRNPKELFYHILVILCLANMLFSICVAYAGIETKTLPGSRAQFFQQLSIFVRHVSLFLTGYYLTTTKRYNKLGILFFITMAICTKPFIDFSKLTLDLKHAVGPILYLSLGDYLVLMSFFLFSLNRNTLFRIILILTSTVLLFLINSRMSFYAYIFLIPLFIFFSKKTKLFVSLIAILIIAGSVLLPIHWNTILYSTRMVGIFNPEGDISVRGRVNLWEAGLERIKRHPFEGDYSAKISRVPGKLFTGYVHNILSYWHTYGITVFFMVIFLSLAGLNFVIKVLFGKRTSQLDVNNSDVSFFILTYLFAFVSAFIARAYVHSILWLSFGLFLNIRFRRERAEIP